MTQTGRAPTPRTLVAAAVLVGVQALVLVVLAVVELVSGDWSRVALAVSTSVFFLLLGAGMAWCARGLLRVDSWARGPVVALQLIGLLLSSSFWGGETTPVAAAILVGCVVTLVAVLHPASTRALAADEG